MCSNFSMDSRKATHTPYRQHFRQIQCALCFLWWLKLQNIFNIKRVFCGGQFKAKALFRSCTEQVGLFLVILVKSVKQIMF